MGAGCGRKSIIDNVWKRPGWFRFVGTCQDASDRIGKKPKGFRWNVFLHEIKRDGDEVKRDSDKFQAMLWPNQLSEMKNR